MTAPPETSTLQPDPHIRLAEVPVFLVVRGFFLMGITLGLVMGLHYYLGARLIRDAQMPEPYATLAWLALWVAFAFIPAGFSLRRMLPRRLSVVVQWLGFVWMGAFGAILATTTFSDLLMWGASHAVTRTAQWSHFQAWVVLAITVPALVFAYVVAHGQPKLVRVTVPVKGLGKGLDGFRIVQITDTHIGETLGRKFLEGVVAKVNALKPDMVAVTGDAIDGTVTSLRAKVEPFSKLAGKHGNFYVTGNHEYYHGGSAWEAEVARLGLTVLHNEHRVLEKDGARLVVAGVTDLEGGRFSEHHRPDADAAFAHAPVGVPRMLLAHQPRFARHVANHNVALQLSGHTHGGQMFPYMVFVWLQQPVIAGFKLLWGVPVYTSRGTGYWGPPFRLGPSGEITEITLRSA